MQPLFPVTINYIDFVECEMVSEVVYLPYIPNPGHKVRLGAKTYTVLETLVDVYEGVILKVEAA